MAEKKKTAKKAEQEAQERDLDLESREVDGGTPELAHASDAIAAGVFDPERRNHPEERRD